MPNKAQPPKTEADKHDQSWAEERHRKQSGHDAGNAQQQSQDTPRRQQGGWHSDAELRRDQRREVGASRDRDYNPDGERPIDRR